MTADKIIIEPVITEKSNRFKEIKKYAFKVDAKANKIMVIKALRELYNVHCLSCNIINVKAKPKRQRYRQEGYTSTWKKAVVTLPANETIPIFEGA